MSTFRPNIDLGLLFVMLVLYFLVVVSATGEHAYLNVLLHLKGCFIDYILSFRVFIEFVSK